MIDVTQLIHEQTGQTASHQHDSGQLFLMLTGSLAFHCPKGYWLIPCQKAGWVPPCTEHGAKWYEPIHATSIHIPPNVCKSLPCQPCVFEPSALLKNIIAAMSTAVTSEYSNQRLENLAQVLIDLLSDIQPSPYHIPLPNDSTLTIITQQIIENPAIEKSLDDWAAEVNLSRRTLTRHFKQKMGLSLGQWIHQVKIIKACELLSKGDNVTTVAFSLGFNQVSVFTTLFKKQLGITPTQFKTLPSEQ